MLGGLRAAYKFGIHVTAVFTICSAIGVARADGQTAAAPRADGWVVIPVEEYRELRLRAFPPGRPPDPPPVDATLTRVDYELRVDGDAATGEARLTVDVLKAGWVSIEIPQGLLVRAARVDGRSIPIIDTPAPHVLLSKPGRVVLSLDIVVPLGGASGTETITMPASKGAVSRLALIVPRPDIDVTVSGGVLSERPATPADRWVAFGRPAQSLTVAWKRRVRDPRATQPLKWRGIVTEWVGLGEETSPLNATVRVEVVQGVAPAVDVAIPEGVIVNQVSGAMVSDWDARPGSLRVTFLEPVSAQTAFSLTAEARVPRQGAVGVPLVRLPAAEPESGGVAVEVLGAGEISDRKPRGLDPADPSELGEPVTGRDSPSMQAFKFRAQPATAARDLILTVARYTPQAVLVATVEEARYDALLEEEGKTLVRARYAVRNNQRAFLAVTLPPGATLWSAAVANRPLRPGVASDGTMLLPLEKGRAGEETPPFAVELIYVQRLGSWADKGRTRLALPSLDLPVARTGVTLHHSPRFSVSPEPGAFRTNADPGPFTATLQEAPEEIATSPHSAAAPAVNEPRSSAQEIAQRITGPEAGGGAGDLIEQYRKDAGVRAIAGPLPLTIPFPRFGASVFLMSELTAELTAPTLEFSYKREIRW
jgi:hypothetical protein